MNLMIMNRKRRNDLDFSNQEIGVYNFARDRLVSKIDFGHIISQTSYTRASITLMPDADGVYHTFAANEVAQTNLGMKIGPAVTNLLKGSDNFFHSDWAKYLGAIITPNIAIAPDGSMTASRVANMPASGGEYLEQTTVITPSSSYTGHMFFKGEGVDIGKTVTLKLKSSSGAAIEDSKTFVLTAGWQKIDVGVDFLPDNAAAKFQLYRHNSETAESFLIWNAQLEAGSYANDPVITGVGVTGVSAAVSVYDDVSELDLTVGGLYLEFEYLKQYEQEPHSNDYGRFFALTDDVGVDSLCLFTEPPLNGNDVRFLSTYGDNAQTPGIAMPTGFYKILCVWSLTELKLFINGSLINSIALNQAFTSASFDKLYIGADHTGGRHQTAIYKKSMLYNLAPSNTQCEALTS